MSLMARPRLIVQRRLKGLENHLAEAARGEVEGIHQARVASRRLREVLPLIAGLGNTPGLRVMRREVKAVTRALGPVRELDVVIQHLDDLLSSAPAQGAAIAAVRRSAGIQRDRAFRRAQRALAQVDFNRLRHRLVEGARHANAPAEELRSAATVADRLADRAAGLQAAALAVGIVYAPGPLHQLRIAVKKYRYALEVAVELGRFRQSAALARLKAIQDQLGYLHDLHVLSVRVRDYMAAARQPGLRPALRALAGLLDERLRQLHLQYLSERMALVPVLNRSRLTVGALRLLPAGVAPASGRAKGAARRGPSRVES